MTPSESRMVIDSLQKTGKLPAFLTPDTIAAMGDSLSKYFNTASEAKIQDYTEKAREVAEAALKTMEIQRPGEQFTTAVGGTRTTGRGVLTRFIEQSEPEKVAEAMGVDFFLRIADEVSGGAGQYIAALFDETRINEYPAFEFLRIYDRRVPRGDEVVKGVQQTWNAWDDPEGRWVAACEDAEDGDIPLKIFRDTGRCVALKDSYVWDSLGAGAGGYTDTLNNPFPPFAFNSGWDWNEVARAEAVELGLMDDSEFVEPPDTIRDILDAWNSGLKDTLDIAGGEIPTPEITGNRAYINVPLEAYSPSQPRVPAGHAS